MLLAKISAVLGLCTAALLGSVTAHPVAQSIDAGNATTTDIIPRLDWESYAPTECSTLLYHCLTIENTPDAFMGFKNLWCHISKVTEDGWLRTYWFNGGCDGQVIMNCPGPDMKRQRGLTYFSFGRHPLGTSRFETSDSSIKLLTSEFQVVVNAPGKTSATTTGMWSDAYLT